MKTDKRMVEDYDVFAIFDSSLIEGFHQVSVGSVVLIEDATFRDMPKELEINGFTYNIEE